jgi:CubicO group peptidase (beta-lactamase class C family)
LATTSGLSRFYECKKSGIHHLKPAIHRNIFDEDASLFHFSIQLLASNSNKMKQDKIFTQTKIEYQFRKLARSSKNVRNAYLLVHSDKLGIHLNVAEGKTTGIDAHPQQPNHLASVGKLFAATVTGILHERGLLSFDGEISKYLDSELMHNLHVYKGIDYSKEIKISHLLKQTSGLNG